MDSADSDTIHLPLLHNAHNNNQNNHGIIGDGSNNFVNSGSITIELGDLEDELDKLLGRHVSKDALRNSFHSIPECYPNTRTTIHKEIGDWLDESGSKKSPLLWLNGPAAVGKSAIAKTISGSYDQIVATFFFSTSSERTAATLIPTLAWQLARSIPNTREHILASLKNRGSLQTSQIEEQFDLLIIQPLKKSTTTLNSRPAMVIDGVDECTDEDMLVRLLRVLVKACEAGDMPVRFIICSRPEPRIHAILGRVRDDNSITNGPEPSTVHKSSKSGVFILSIVLIAGIALIVAAAFLASIVLLTFKSSSAEVIILMPLTVSFTILALPLLLALLASCLPYRPTSEAHLHAIQRSRPFMKGALELYRPIRLGVDKDAPLPETSGETDDALDRIYPHPVISIIRIGISEESKADITRYLTDRLSAIHPPGEDTTSPWFQPSDISRLVEASCGQFLYASVIVKLLDDPHFDPRDVFEKARRGSLPTPDLDKLYEAVLKRAYDTIRNGRHYQMELRILKDSLATLVFFAGNVHFFSERKNLPVIETLLGLKSGKLSLKLSKLHSVLRIIPEETIHVHHRSFVEFLQNRERSGEYHIGYSYGLLRILILMTRAGFRYHIIHFRRRSELKCVKDMVTECRRNFFGRSRFPLILTVLHFSIHFAFTFAVYLWCYLPLSRFNTRLTIALSPIIFFPTFIGTYIISLIIYTLFFNRSVIVPLFHPFLHPLFVFMGGFLFPLRLFLFLLVVTPILCILIPALGVGVYFS